MPRRDPRGRLCWICARRHHTELLPSPDGRMDEDEHDAFVHIFMIATPGITKRHPDRLSPEFEAEIAALATAVGRFGGCVAAKARAKARMAN